MITWIYIIKNFEGKIITKNCDFAERKSKLGYFVFCKRAKNLYKYHH
jgi:hypothetical protein